MIKYQYAVIMTENEIGFDKELKEISQVSWNIIKKKIIGKNMP